jgi:type I restriction enzyme R subunit
MAAQKESGVRNQIIDAQLREAGWLLCDLESAAADACEGVAIREFPLDGGLCADYLLYVGGKAAGVVEAKREGRSLAGVEPQTEKYAAAFPADYPAWSRPLRFSYQHGGAEIFFTDRRERPARARGVFGFHTPQALRQMLEAPPDADFSALPPLDKTGLWRAQAEAVIRLEQSLIAGRRRALLQMATGSGKTRVAVCLVYRLIRYAGLRRALFLVDRANLARQAEDGFSLFSPPHTNLRFGEEYNIARLSGAAVPESSRVCVCTVQRMYSILRGRELSEEDDARSAAGVADSLPPLKYNPDFPIDLFDFIVIDECHRSIFNLWRQVLEYFDARLVGLTATPNSQAFAFFGGNLAMEYPHERAVADGVNVPYEVFRIRTEISERGGMVPAGYYVQREDRKTRRALWEKLDEDLAYDAKALDRRVATPDQIRKVVRAFRDSLPKIFPAREWVPKTLVFAKDDAHAERIVRIIREEFDEGNDFAVKITYRASGESPEALLKQFRGSSHPRIAVTVDMVATGTDIKPVEILLFMRAVRSRVFFEQMKGRGVRVISPDDFHQVTPDAEKTRYVIIDAVGVCEGDKTDSRPLDTHRSHSLDKLLQAVALGASREDLLTSVAARISVLRRRMTEQEEARFRQIAGVSPCDFTHILLDAAGAPGGGEAESEAASENRRQKARERAVAPLQNPELRNLLLQVRDRAAQVTVDAISEDRLIDAGYDETARERANRTAADFREFIEKNRDELAALRILFARPYRAGLDEEALRELARKLREPPFLLGGAQLWEAYRRLDESKVRGANKRRLLTDLIPLVRFAAERDSALIPFAERVGGNFDRWLVGRDFSLEQRRWLEMMRDHIVGSAAIAADDLELDPFAAGGGLAKASALFGDSLGDLLAELNEKLAA